MDAIQSDDIKAVIATLAPEQKEVITEYFDALALVAESIHTSVEVSQLAFESLGLAEGGSIGKTLFSAGNDTFDLYTHFAAMAAEGVQE